jgi:hypothetical protein
MKYLLLGLGSYSIATGWFFTEENDSLVSLFVGGGLGLLLIFGAVVLAVADSFKERK